LIDVSGIHVERNYFRLYNVLIQALSQAQDGKGKERHANDLPFEKQPSVCIARRRGSGYPRGQIEKKILEVDNLSTTEAQIREMLSIIVYAAIDIIVMQDNMVYEQKATKP